MRLVKICLLIFFIGVLPFVLGLLPASFLKEKNAVSNALTEGKRKPGIVIIAGWFLMFALFQVIAVPVIILQKSFTMLVIMYNIVLCVGLVSALLRGKGILRSYLDTAVKLWKKRSWKQWNVEKAGFVAGCIVAAGLLALQLTATFTLEHYDGDDAYYVASSVATDLYDTMYVRDNYTGYQFTLESRHALSPTPIFIAWLSRMTGVHSTILCHSVLGPFFIALMYLVYWQIADKLFQDKKQYKPWFLAFLMIWFLFGNVSIYTTETFALTRIWQGKGLVAAIIIPTMLLCYFMIFECYEKKEVAVGEWMILVSTVFTAVLATTTSIFLVPIFGGMAGVLLAFRQKRIMCLIQMCGAMVPALCYGVMYMILR